MMESMAVESQRKKIIAQHAREHGASEPSNPLWSVLRYAWRASLLGLLGASTAATYYTYAYEIKEVNQQIKEGKEKYKGNALGEAWISALQWYIRVRKDLTQQVRDFTDPTYHKLLPDLPAEYRGRLKTLVLDLDDLLVHKEWTRQKGWTIFRRAGVQDFILEMGQYYEVVIFTDEPNTYADPILNRLDTHKVIPFRLYRPETQYHNGKHVRDLSKLNRDLKQVLMISADPDAWEFQPENTLKLKPWKGESEDTMLLDLIPFLQMIAMRNVGDVRSVVKSYDGEENVPAAFKARLQASAQHQQQTQQKPRLGFLAQGAR